MRFDSLCALALVSVTFFAACSTSQCRCALTEKPPCDFQPGQLFCGRTFDGDPQTLRAVAGFLKRNPRQRLQIEGHAADVGAKAESFRAANERARQVAKFLVDNGATDGQVQRISMGAERPRYAPPTDRRNNRIELVFLDVVRSDRD